MKRWKTLGLWTIFFVAAAMFVCTQSFAMEHKAEGVGKGGEAGMMAEHAMKMGQHGKEKSSRRVTELIGKPVVTTDGMEAGTLNDIVIFEGGRVHFGILAVQSADGEKYVPIPFESFTDIEGEDQLTVDLTKEKIDTAPGFTEQELGSWWKSETADKVHGHYGMETKMMRMKKTMPGVGKGPESGIKE